MSDKKKPINEGYIPKKSDIGYQPSKPPTQPVGGPKYQGGYVPAIDGHDSSMNNPPGDE